MAAESERLRHRKATRAPLRHPNAPCDEQGLPLRVLRSFEDVAVVSYRDEPERGIFVAGIGSDGVARIEVRDVSYTQAVNFLRELEENRD